VNSTLLAAIDMGSNTLRMLIASLHGDCLNPDLYCQQITRLAGGYRPGTGLAQKSMNNTLAVISEYADLLQSKQVVQVRVVATAALRRAENAQLLVNLIKLKAGLNVEIITGQEEAQLSFAGVMSALVPVPKVALIIDIGGGSTELIFSTAGKVLFSRSYPLGVVQLCEEWPESPARNTYLADMIVKFSSDLLHAGITPQQLSACQIVGTAGTVTSLAALDLEMTDYDRNRVNNHQLDLSWLEGTLARLNTLSIPEREALPGLEPGRGDLIIPGLELVIALCRYLKKPSLLVSDSGLLEGILLDF